MDGPKAGDKIYDLTEIIEEALSDKELESKKTRIAIVNSTLQEEIARRVEEVTERIAREMIPDIVERVIREEIEKLKR
ncbi:MAG: hypothetical protein N2317_04980 [Syntrophales bacterium]|nr:hypothetical protein [Syntrophales bacterium]